MGRAKSQKIGRWTFGSIIAVKKHIGGILDRHGHEQRLKGEDDELMRAVVDIHPSRSQILNGSTIDYIYVEYLSEVYGYKTKDRRFSVRRADGSPFDFAWKWAFESRKPFGYLLHVLRGEIQEWKDAQKRKLFRGRCEHCGKRITFARCHLDHVPPATFAALVEGFLKLLRKTATDIEIHRSTEYGSSSYLANPVERDAWFEYHQINARFRCLCQPCNQSVTRRKRPR